MPSVDNNLCLAVNLSMLSGCTLVSIRMIRDMMIERRPTIRIIHVLNPRRIPNVNSRKPTMAIDMNTDIVERITSLMRSCEYWFVCFTL